MFRKGLVKRWLTVAVAVAAAGFPPAAQAMFIGGGAASVPVTPPVSVSHTSHTALGPTDASSGGYDFVATAVPATAQSGSGFQWGDAGIGAAGAVALMGAGAAASLTVRRRRVRQIVTG